MTATYLGRGPLPEPVRFRCPHCGFATRVTVFPTPARPGGRVIPGASEIENDDDGEVTVGENKDDVIHWHRGADAPRDSGGNLRAIFMERENTP